jgi:hypothetical protein
MEPRSTAVTNSIPGRMRLLAMGVWIVADMFWRQGKPARMTRVIATESIAGNA